MPGLRHHVVIFLWGLCCCHLGLGFVHRHNLQLKKLKQADFPEGSPFTYQSCFPTSSPLRERLRLNGSRKDPSPSWSAPIMEDIQRSALFSALMIASGAILGPFLDSYHSAFGVLQYNKPISLELWGSNEFPALTTTWWVPELFGVAGFLIGWLYIIFDAILFAKNDDSRDVKDQSVTASVPKICIGISFFTFQYWLSGILVYNEIDRTTLLNLMSAIAALGFYALDGTLSGFIVSAATGIGGPLIEVGLIWSSSHGLLASGYHYTDLGETGFFPLWILPVYFLGGPANGNLARGLWKLLSTNVKTEAKELDLELVKYEPCEVCNDTRCVPCPNCDGIGSYVAIGGRGVKCTGCRGRGFVICRACFDRYDEDPYDIDAIRDKMSRMPD